MTYFKYKSYETLIKLVALRCLLLQLCGLVHSHYSNDVINNTGI